MEAFVFCSSPFCHCLFLKFLFSKMSVRGGGNYLLVTCTADFTLSFTKKRALLWLLGDGSVRDR